MVRAHAQDASHNKGARSRAGTRCKNGEYAADMEEDDVPWNEADALDGAEDGIPEVTPAEDQREVVYSVLTSPAVQLPARQRQSSFGNDDELNIDLPENWTLKKFQTEAKAALDELFVSRAVPDCAARVQRLLDDCPSEADEFGCVALRMAVDRDVASQDVIVRFFSKLHEVPGQFSNSTATRSFEKVICAWEDISIDSPSAPQVIIRMLRGCIAAKVVPHNLLTKLPQNLLNEGLKSVGAAPLPPSPKGGGKGKGAKGGYSPPSGPAASPAQGGVDELQQVANDLKVFKKKIEMPLEEFFVALCEQDIEDCLTDLNMASYHHEFVKRLVVLSFSQANDSAARDATISLLMRLTQSSLVTKDDIQWGVTRLLSQLDDISLDCPKAKDLIVDILVQFVTKELVSVPFLRRCRALRIGGASGVQALDSTCRRTPEYSRRYATAASTATFKKELLNMILEYFDSGGEAEFGRCVSELAPLSRAQSAEIVRKILCQAMERNAPANEKAIELLVWLCRHEELDCESIEAGFEEMYSRMDDIKLDVPDAPARTQSFVNEAQKKGILGSSWKPRC